MAKDPELHNDPPAERGPSEDFSLGEDDAILDALGEIKDALLEYVVSRLPDSAETGLLADCLSEGLLISVLKLIAPNGKYPMEQGYFWQILDRHNPFSPLGAEDTIRARLASEIEGLFAAAGNEGFEDGFDSVLSLELQRLVLKHGDMTLEIISDLILENRAAPEAAAEALRCLGEMENETSHEARRRLLERSLACSSHVTRDGAVVGLSNLSDRRMIPALEAAAAREDYGLLRANMSELLAQLKGLQQ